MFKKILLFGNVFVLATGLAFAEAEFDFEELMESIDTNSHNLQGNITNKDANAAIPLAKDLLNSFKLVEGFFAKRGDAADAVTDAKRYEDMANDIVKFLEEKNFDAASTKAIELSNSCDDACHDTYKPL